MSSEATAIIAIIIAAIILLAIILLAIIIYAIVASFKGHEQGRDFLGEIFEDPQRRAGRRGEQVACDIIRGVLREDDLFFRNVRVSHEGKPTELDNVIVNTCGVFIIEVKNYKGRLVGNEDDYKWTQYKTTDAGNTYEKPVSNPIKQVKRQAYILAHYLEYYGPKVWVSGYAMLLHRNSPVESSYVLSSTNDIDRAIHTHDRRGLNRETVSKIALLLSQPTR